MASIYSSVSPVHGSCYIGQPYANPGKYKCGFHTGIDFPKSLMSNPTLYACCTGTVVAVYKNVSGNHVGRALGNEVDIQRDGDGLIFRYCHMEYGSNNHLNVGDRVDTNTVVGITGNTGNSDGAHLHLECATSVYWSCQTFVNPGDALGIGNERGTYIIYDGGVTPPEPPPDPPEPPEPEPDPGEDSKSKKRFPWVLYANKLRYNNIKKRR